MTKCDHISCGSKEKLWLPYIYQGRECGLKPHPYCTECGLVMNLSLEKPRSIGYYINVLGALGREFKITKVQIRLISQELKKEGMEDDYGMDRHQQEELFIEIVTKYINVPDWMVRKFI